MSARIIPMFRGTRDVRDDDGVVVFAMRAAEVRVDDWGFSCLLWRPASSDEARLRHCRLAVRNGMAEGFLLYGNAVRRREREMLSLRVFKLGKEYWAKWGGMATGLAPQRCALAVGARL